MDNPTEESVLMDEENVEDELKTTAERIRTRDICNRYQTSDTGTTQVLLGPDQCYLNQTSDSGTTPVIRVPNQ